MKTTAMAAMVLITGAAAYAQSSLTAADRTVTVCFDQLAGGLNSIGAAKIVAHKIFDDIGLKIDWRNSALHCPGNAIIINVRDRTPATLRPGALAYALPFEGTHIEIFGDRVSELAGLSMASIVLAHVLVHEITHILQGMCRHSEMGIMKARWEDRDVFLMRRRALKLTPQDVVLIERGLVGRAQHSLLAMNGTAAVAGQ
jgi:hypothetical protein